MPASGVARVGLTEKVPFAQRLEGNEEKSHADMEGWHSRNKGHEA